MNQSENSPRFDISTYLPLGVGAISLFGICLLLVASRIASPRSTVEIPDTATPFRYLFIGTEPGISSAVPSQDGTPGEEGFELTPDAASTRPVGFAITAQSGFSGSGSNPTAVDMTQQDSLSLTPENPIGTVPSLRTPTLIPRPGLPTPTRSGITNTPVSLFTLSGPTNTVAVTLTRTPTSAAPPPLGAGTYDDIESRLNYTGSWDSQTNVPDAESGTLHVSSTIGNTITFRFIGDQIRIFYQSGSGLGFITAKIDEQEYPPLSQNGPPTVNSEWAITGLTNATHTMIITHSSGGSINLDQIIVPDIASATATP